jgi:hypothetical protein
MPKYTSAIIKLEIHYPSIGPAGPAPGPQLAVHVQVGKGKRIGYAPLPTDGLIQPERDIYPVMSQLFEAHGVFK